MQLEFEFASTKTLYTSSGDLSTGLKTTFAGIVSSALNDFAIIPE